MKIFRIIFFSFFIFSQGFCDIFDKYDEYVKHDKRSRFKFNEFSSKISKTFYLPLECGNGLGTFIDDKTTIWCSKYIVHGHKLTVDEMRPIILNAVQYLWQNVKKEKSFSEYMRYKAELENKDCKLTIDFIGMRIDLWDEKNDRYKYPFLSQVLLKGGKIHYYYANPETQALQQPGVTEDLPSWVIENN